VEKVQKEREVPADIAGNQEMLADVFVTALTETLRNRRISQKESNLVCGSFAMHSRSALSISLCFRALAEGGSIGRCKNVSAHEFFSEKQPLTDKAR